jgi:amino acid transporter
MATAEDKVEAGDITNVRSHQAAEGELKETGRDTKLTQTYGSTHRGLKPRHVQLMAIGGSIGIGIWVCRLRRRHNGSS